MGFTRCSERPMRLLAITILYLSSFHGYGQALPTSPGGNFQIAQIPGAHGLLAKRVAPDLQKLQEMTMEGWSVLACSMLEDVAGMEVIQTQATGGIEPNYHFQCDSRNYFRAQDQYVQRDWHESRPHPTTAQWKQPVQDYIATLQPLTPISTAMKPAGPNQYIKLTQDVQWKMKAITIPTLARQILPATNAFYDLIINLDDGVMVILDSISFEAVVTPAYSAMFDDYNEQQKEKYNEDPPGRHMDKSVAAALAKFSTDDQMLGYAWHTVCRLDAEQRYSADRRTTPQILNAPDSPSKHLKYIVQQSLRMSTGSAEILRTLLQKTSGGQGDVPVYPAHQSWRMGDWQFLVSMQLPELLTVPKFVAARKTLLSHKSLASIQIFRASPHDEPTFAWALEDVTPQVRLAARQRKDASLLALQSSASGTNDPSSTAESPQEGPAPRVQSESPSGEGADQGGSGLAPGDREMTGTSQQGSPNPGSGGGRAGADLAVPDDQYMTGTSQSGSSHSSSDGSRNNPMGSSYFDNTFYGPDSDRGSKSRGKRPA